MLLRRILLAASVLLLAACNPDARPRPFADGSAWNRELPDGAYGRPDANSGTWVNQLRGGSSVLDTREYGVPVFEGTSPQKTVDCTASWCQDDGRLATVPSGAHGAPGTDGAMSVWDQSRDVAFDWWQVKSIGSSVITSTDASHSCTANDNSACDGNGVTITGSGVSRLAGVFTEADHADGHISHAVVFSSYTVNGSCVFRYPATKSDGCKSAQRVSVPLPEGAVLMLDPAYNVDAANVPEWNRMMLRAMQTYGAAAIDSGGAAAAWIADEIPVSDYAGVFVPWSNVRVLRNWQGT